MDLGLNGKVAMVGGASKGIGFNVARLLAKEGVSVAISSRVSMRSRPWVNRPAAASGLGIIGRGSAQYRTIAADCNGRVRRALFTM